MAGNAHVDGDVETRAADMLTGVLVKRLGLVADRARHPEIADEVVAAPVFIVGQPRSGSTHLHALLVCVAGFRAPCSGRCRRRRRPRTRDLLHRPRIAAVQAMVDQMPAEMLVRHPMSATRPEQCNLMMDWTFINQAWMASFAISSYREWFLDADYAPAYEAAPPDAAAAAVAQPGPVGPQVPEAPALARCVARPVPGCGADLDPSRPGRGAAIGGEPHRYMRQSNTPDYDPVRFAREWVVIESSRSPRACDARPRGRRRATSTSTTRR